MTGSSPEEASPHRPVLYHEIIHALNPRRGGYYVDATLGAGGHAWGILQASSPDGKLLGLDPDPQAIGLASERLAGFGSRAFIIQASYATLGEQLAQLGWPGVDGVLFDLGVSSMQLATPERGFSFQSDGALDMRFDPQSPLSAADLVNRLPQDELADLIFRYGEERQSRRIAKAIVEARPIDSTRSLAEVVAQAVGSREHYKTRGKSSRTRGENHLRIDLHPATLTFQALRIAVNRELETLEHTLPQAVAALASGGRLAVISFHSLEDRIVKQYFRRESQDCICPPRQPVCTCGHKAVLIEITRRPIKPQAAELRENPRSRSARFRLAEKL